MKVGSLKAEEVKQAEAYGKAQKSKSMKARIAEDTEKKDSNIAQIQSTITELLSVQENLLHELRLKLTTVLAKNNVAYDVKEEATKEIQASPLYFDLRNNSHSIIGNNAAIQDMLDSLDVN
jgi:signal recognition particle GTPase